MGAVVTVLMVRWWNAALLKAPKIHFLINNVHNTAFYYLHTVPSAVSWHLLFLSRSTSYSVCVATTCLCRCSARLWRCPDPRRRPQRWVKTFIIAWGVEERVEGDIHSSVSFKLKPGGCKEQLVYVHNFIEISSCFINLHSFSAALDIKWIFKLFLKISLWRWLLILQVEI